MSKDGSIEERLTQAEKDIQDLTFIVQKLLTWKRNQATRTLPTTQPQPHVEELLKKAAEP